MASITSRAVAVVVAVAVVEYWCWPVTGSPSLTAYVLKRLANMAELWPHAPNELHDPCSAHAARLARK